MKFLAKLSLILFFVFLSKVSARSQLPIIKSIEDIQKSTGVGAVAYVLVEKGQLVSTGGFGQYSLQDKTPVDQNSLFKIGSITKTFTAIAILQQVEKGQLKLDTPIKSILKKIPLNNPFLDKPVTLEMLLEHTSGLQDLTRKEFDYPEPLSLVDAFKIAPMARLVKYPPGYQYNYSNAGAGYLGRAIEVVNSVDYDDWFEFEILEKMGMMSSSLRWAPETESQLVTGYDSDLITPISYWHTLFRPFGGINTTALDMSKLLILFTSPRNTKWKQIITPESLQRMETPTTSLAAKAGLNIGYGLALRSEIYRGQRLFGHGGDGDGYLAQFSYSKQSGRGYFFVINAFRHDIDNKFTTILDDWLIENLPKKPYQQKKFLLPLKQKEAIVGEYAISTSRFSRTNNHPLPTKIIRIQNSELQICSQGLINCKGLNPQSNHLFHSEGDYVPSTVIVKADDGNTYMQYDNRNYMLNKLKP